jgi:hypothetical protein
VNFSGGARLFPGVAPAPYSSRSKPCPQALRDPLPRARRQRPTQPCSCTRPYGPCATGLVFRLRGRPTHSAGHFRKFSIVNELKDWGFPRAHEEVEAGDPRAKLRMSCIAEAYEQTSATAPIRRRLRDVNRAWDPAESRGRLPALRAHRRPSFPIRQFSDPELTMLGHSGMEGVGTVVSFDYRRRTTRCSATRETTEVLCHGVPQGRRRQPLLAVPRACRGTFVTTSNLSIRLTAGRR